MRHTTFPLLAGLSLPTTLRSRYLCHVAAIGLLLAAAGPAIAQQEMLFGGFDTKAWEIGHQTSNQNQIVVEFVRHGETVNNWTELLTMQAIRKSSTTGSLDELVPKLFEDLARRCPSMKWNVVHRNFSNDTEEAGMVYEWILKDCPPDADQHEIARVAVGRFNIFRLADVAKTSALAPEKRESVIKEISTARIVRR
jgi:hypothetical protein